ncbi:MAG: SWIM zinc finger family protein [Chloroflexota bacterium]
MSQTEVSQPASVYLAGALALTDPGPAAAGIYVKDAGGRLIAHRSYYLGHAGGREAAVRAVVLGLRLARQLQLHLVVLRVDDPWLEKVLRGQDELSGELSHYASDIARARDVIDVRVGTIKPEANLARPVALAPLVQWLPERARRAEALKVTPMGEGEYEVASERTPEVVYKVRLPSPEKVSQGESIRCSCPDYEYRGVPCKHLLVVAQSTGGMERLFYPEAAGGSAIPSGPPDVESPGPKRDAA